MAILHGEKVQVFIGTSGTTPMVAGAKSCTIQEQADTYEVASASNQTSKEFIPGRTSWTGEISHLVVQGAAAGALSQVGTKVHIRFVNESSAICQGDAIVTDAKLTFTALNLAQGSVKLQGTGPLT